MSRSSVELPSLATILDARAAVAALRARLRGSPATGALALVPAADEEGLCTGVQAVPGAMSMCDEVKNVVIHYVVTSSTLEVAASLSQEAAGGTARRCCGCNKRSALLPALAC